MVDVDTLVPKYHLLRKIEDVMDYEWLYARLSPYYCVDNGRPGTDPVVLIKQVVKMAKVYEEQLRKEVAEERRKPGRKDKNDDDASGSSTGGGTVEKAVSKTDPDCGMFVKGTQTDRFTCPRGHELQHTTTSKEGKRTYRSSPKICKDCPCRTVCGANESGQRILTTHIWQEYLDLAEQLRKTERGKVLYAIRKEAIERVFALAPELPAFSAPDGPCCCARAVRWKSLPFLPPDRFAPSLVSCDDR